MSAVDELTSNAGRLLQVPLEQLHPAGDNPRGAEMGDLEGLAASIRSSGVLQPLLVTPNGDGWTIVAGHRRHAAAALAGLDAVPCVVAEGLDDDHRRLDMLIENLQREDLDPIAEARGYRQLVKAKWSQRKIAGAVGCTQGHVSKRLSLLDLPKVAVEALSEQRLTIEEGLELAKLAKLDRRAATKLAKQHLEPGYHTDITYAVAREIKQATAKAARERLVAALQERQVALLDLPDVNSWELNRKLPDGALPIGRRGGLDLDPDQHTSEPCHAVAVTRASSHDAAEQVPVCTDPSRHGHEVAKVDDRERAQREAEAAAKEAHREALLAAARTRDKLVDSLARNTKAPTKDALTDAVGIALEIALAHTYRDLDEVLTRLQIADPGPGNSYELQKGAIRNYATEGPAYAVGALIALWAADRESDLARGWHRWDESDRRYIAWLTRHGHTLSDAERAELDRIDQDDADG